MNVERIADENAERREAFTETPLFEGLARAGYVARGVIYALIGVLAIRLADGVGRTAPEPAGRDAADRPPALRARCCSC